MNNAILEDLFKTFLQIFEFVGVRFKFVMRLITPIVNSSLEYKEVITKLQGDEATSQMYGGTEVQTTSTNYSMPNLNKDDNKKNKQVLK